MTDEDLIQRVDTAIQNLLKFKQRYRDVVDRTRMVIDQACIADPSLDRDELYRRFGVSRDQPNG